MVPSALSGVLCSERISDGQTRGRTHEASKRTPLELELPLHDDETEIMEGVDRPRVDAQYASLEPAYVGLRRPVLCICDGKTQASPQYSVPLLILVRRNRDER